MTDVVAPKFSRWRSYLWPIHSWEYGRFIPMLLIFFCISFNYNLLRAAKDTLIITAPSSGAETLPFIKVWVMMPIAVLITFIFTKLSSKYGREKVFYIMMAVFLVFYALFTYVLYPARDFLHPESLAQRLELITPLGFRGLLALFRNWTLTLYYVMAELWGAMILSVLFWGFANQTTSVKEAKRFYTFFGVGANIAGILSGQTAIAFSSFAYQPKFFYGSTAWDQSVFTLNTTVILIGLLIIAIFRYHHKHNLQPKSGEKHTSSIPKEKMSLRKSFRYLAQSKYLICIALIVLTYNIGINLIEVIWKNEVHELYPNPSDFNKYMGQVMSIIGVIATVIAIFISGNLLRRFTWTVNALIPPVIILISGTLFLSFFLMKSYNLSGIPLIAASSPLALSVFFGTLHNSFGRASKFTLFDSTKEIAFIPLSNECKMKGKAAIDGVGSRLGKSGGSMIHSGLLIVCGTFALSAPFVAAIFILVTIIWIFSALSLGKQFHELIAQKEEIPPPAQEANKLVEKEEIRV